MTGIGVEGLEITAIETMNQAQRDIHIAIQNLKSLHLFVSTERPNLSGYHFPKVLFTAYYLLKSPFY